MENNRYREEEQELEQETETNEEVTEEKQEPQPEVNTEEHISKNKKRINHLKEKISELEQELALKDDELLRERAELINFKRRLNEEKINDRKYANQALLADLINVIDIFDRVVSSPAQDEKVKKYLVGFQMINEQLKGVMSQYGVTKIDALNKPFDATRHEAIETIESDAEPNTVIEVISDGYMFKDRVLRPSMVKVSKQKENK